MLEELFKKIREGREASETSSREIDYLVVGLGNPGKEYEATWHNLGFLALEELERRHGFRCDRIRFKGLISDTNLFGKRIIFLKPQTFMNRSGESIREALNFYKLDPKQLIVIYDDFELPLGELRIRKKGGSGTHNGMKDILYQIKSELFPRIRVGFGPKPPYMDVASFVLSKIPEDKKADSLISIKAAADAVELIIKEDIDTAMNKLNGVIAKT